jgi:hypothetical protein
MFLRIKTIKKNGRSYRYLYREERVREGKRVRSISTYLGACDPRQDRAIASADRQAAKTDAYQREHFGETGQERADREAAAQFSQESFLEATQEPSGDEASAPEE